MQLNVILSSSVFCRVLYCVEFCIVSSSVLCQGPVCVKVRFVPRSGLCQVPVCVMFRFVSRSSLCQGPVCVKVRFVSRSGLCQGQSELPFVCLLVFFYEIACVCGFVQCRVFIVLRLFHRSYMVLGLCRHFLEVAHFNKEVHFKG